jgi:ubiquitin-like-conjugating enzyme ATG3
MNKFFDSVGNFMGDQYRGVAKKFMGVLKESKFYEEGVLTPEEYIRAGDFLTTKCPTWKWCSASKDTLVSEYLPKEKQFLKTTVPCPMRVLDYDKHNKHTETMLDNGWVETKIDFYGRKENKDELVDFDNIGKENDRMVINNNIIKDEYFADIDVITDNNTGNNQCIAEEVNEIVIVEQNEDNVIKTRTYDVSVTYDFFYRVPRFWLYGYSENGTPLTDNEVKEDIMLEYVDRTVTIEKHPHTDINCVSIHPCKHSALLKKMIDNFELAGKRFEIDFAILIFLKFVNSVVPTIQYDFTLDIDF